MLKIKIDRRIYRNARQSDLLTYAENVFKLMRNAAKYQTLQAEVEALQGIIKNYGAALAAALNGGYSDTLSKKRFRKELIRQLDLLADGVEMLSNGDEQMFVDAGFSKQQDTGLRFTGTLPPPEILKAFSTGKKGELYISLNNFFPRNVRTHGIICSIDGGAVWRSEVFDHRRAFKLIGLPHAAEMLIQIRSIGKAHLVSAWSSPIMVAVI